MKQLFFSLLLIMSLSLCVNAQALKEIDEVAPFNEGLGGVKKGDAWGFIDSDGELVIKFREDIVETPKITPIFNDGLCLIKKVKDGITFYGYINTKGEEVIPVEYLKATPFDNGFVRVIIFIEVVTSNFIHLIYSILYIHY